MGWAKSTRAAVVTSATKGRHAAMLLMPGIMHSSIVCIWKWMWPGIAIIYGSVVCGITLFGYLCVLHTRRRMRAWSILPASYKRGTHADEYDRSIKPLFFYVSYRLSVSVFLVTVVLHAHLGSIASVQQFLGLWFLVFVSECFFFM